MKIFPTKRSELSDARLDTMRYQPYEEPEPIDMKQLFRELREIEIEIAKTNRELWSMMKELYPVETEGINRESLYHSIFPATD